MQIPEIPAQCKFVSEMCHAHNVYLIVEVLDYSSRLFIILLVADGAT